ncbi:MAG TPA: hypothetical protein VGN87_07445 [Paenibacillus sp.]
MDAEVRFSEGFFEPDGVYQFIAAKIRERYGALELKMKQEAARHLLSNIVGAEYSSISG